MRKKFKELLKILFCELKTVGKNFTINLSFLLLIIKKKSDVIHYFFICLVDLKNNLKIPPLID